MKHLLLIFGICMSAAAFAQAPVDTTLKVVHIGETVVSATRSSQARTAVAQQVTVLRQAEIEQLNTSTAADLIQQSGAAFVQKSQQGGGSPVLRGFEASRVLLVVDGIRMNNAIYRAGHLQNIITMDNAALERAEILYGPASTAYGSDALGGAICFYTKNPVFAEAGESLRSGGNAFFRYGSANEEKTAHVEVNVGGQRVASITAYTFSDFGDLRMGENNGFAAFFGKRRFYADRIGGRDTILRNPDPYVQKFSGYRQYDLLEKVVFRPNANSSHTLNVQYSTSSDIPRYDRLTDPGPQGLRYSEWYYGPQQRLLAAYKFALQEWGWFNGGVRATLSYQNIEESRHDRRFGNPQINHRMENVGVWGLETEAEKHWEHQSMSMGLDFQYNDVQSEANRENIETGVISPQNTRYPDGGGQMYNIAVFATHSWQVPGNEQWTFSEGLRGGFTGLKARFDDKTFFPFPYDEATQNTAIWSASLGAVWNSPEGWRLALNASSGFRVPNIDDLGKVFDSQPGSVIVPNPDIKPEKTYNFDLGITRVFAERLRWENVLWVTAFRDAIVTDVFRFNGQDSVLYDGEMSLVLANQNKRRARIWGFSSNLEADVYDDLALFGSLHYTRGRILQDEGDDLPLDHIPPMYGRVGFRWHTPRASVEGFLLFNGSKDINDYLPNGEDNEQYAPSGGMPAWMTANLNGSYRFRRVLALQAGIDNLFDTQYRVFSSGINGPGRNFRITLRVRW
ncbi:MAG: TonB-dependent receptor [Saprospiraceae bacterium]